MSDTEMKALPHAVHYNSSEAQRVHFQSAIWLPLKMIAVAELKVGVVSSSPGGGQCLNLQWDG